MFASAALGQLLLVKVGIRLQLSIAVAGCAVGLAAVAAGAIAPQLGVFLAGAVVSGFGVGLLFKGSIGTAVALADPARRGETLAVVFLVAYTGLAVPALAAGAALNLVAATTVLTVFAALVLAATATAGVLLRARSAAAGR